MPERIFQRSKAYIRASWIIKIRLMSARRQLWAQEASLIHLENACVQLRKICEGSMHLALLAGEIDFGDIPKTLRKKYQVDKVLRHLTSINRLRFPRQARLHPVAEVGDNTHWKLDIAETTKTDHDVGRVISIWQKTGKILHERSPFADWPESEEVFQSALWHDLNAIRGDHQFLWNFLWQHRISLASTEVFFLNMGDMSQPTRPMLVKMEGFLPEDLEFTFDPDFFADFSGPIDWADFD